MATYPAYFSKLRHLLFINNKKCLTKKAVEIIDERCLAYMWMCDGYLAHSKNRVKDKIQNIGFLCLESFDVTELQYFCLVMNNKYNLDFRLKKVQSGYRPFISGSTLQKFISLIYPFLTNTFQYKAKLFYKTNKYCDNTLPNAGDIFVYYNNIQEYEDIVDAY